MTGALGMMIALGMTIVVGLLPAPAMAQREHPISAEIREPAGGFTARAGEKFTLTLAVDSPSSPIVWHL